MGRRVDRLAMLVAAARPAPSATARVDVRAELRRDDPERLVGLIEACHRVKLLDRYCPACQPASQVSAPAFVDAIVQQDWGRTMPWDHCHGCGLHLRLIT